MYSFHGFYAFQLLMATGSALVGTTTVLLVFAPQKPTAAATPLQPVRSLKGRARQPRLTEEPGEAVLHTH